MHLHAYRHDDGTFEIVYDRALLASAVAGARDLGVADIDLSAFSTSLVLTIGLSARATARGRDAVVVADALARRDAQVATDQS
jgi:hypothetical protein